MTCVTRWKKQFKQLLEDTGYVTPGKHLSEVRVLFMGRECFEALSEHDCQQIYDNHQRELIESAKHNFQVALLIILTLRVFIQVVFLRNCYLSMQTSFIISKV